MVKVKFLVICILLLMGGTLMAQTSGSIKGHKYVDLGLSVKWATCNVGTSSPSKYGNYYAWGEKKTKSKYTEENSVTYWYDIDNIAGDPQYDVATAKWGGTWRLPTVDEMEELIDKCKWEWITYEGKKGYKVIGPNGNYIFLPAAGWRGEKLLRNAGELGSYWTATPRDNDTSFASHLYFDSDEISVDWPSYRSAGLSVRPVSE